ncbi:uncharacterized protein MONOS_4974 [Monocercomonoides exilis]|uniref:uncharacterized protein n=1 Tax=Monocercomonoides exilis TaxID=2049356 RepID=UPI0035599E67|nr:hypothetical protein MONOS_4974 [Monocercomonoides exilis]|eukprot:MONOS_4974.1-p1 / transcript=MONOS_4974.1 / gene=MONOS_4974 / organism=Monocercomonoides_exilis_PA203 / gene_product=unspecified product / transcript_product=unspecified product / location=Mono_scaffold00139:72343-73475(+) / protein_length=336 / sequence_SO=supercontig / SO=protein_coding / is_pseudo=false
MTLRIDDKHIDEIRKIPTREKFLKLLDDLENCDEDEQKQKICEMNGLLEEMNKKEFRSIFNKETFNKIYKMIEEKKMTIENAILLLKHIGYCKVLKNVWSRGFYNSELNKRFEKMIFYENEKKEEKNEKLIIDLCECCLFLSCSFTPELLSICLSCLLKAASKKEESEETRKENEMALLALSEIGYCEMKQELYLNEITEIIEHQQKHRNLTHLAYQSAWQFFIYRCFNDYSLKEVIVNELHFVREAARELEELLKFVNWKRKEVERGKETKEEFALIRWFRMFYVYFCRCKLKNEEITILIGGIVQVYRAAKGNNEEIRYKCIYSLGNAAENRV